MRGSLINTMNIRLKIAMPIVSALLDGAIKKYTDANESLMFKQLKDLLVVHLRQFGKPYTQAMKDKRVTEVQEVASAWITAEQNRPTVNPR